MPFSGLGTTPGAAPSGNPDGDGVPRRVLQIHGDQRLGAGVDDVQLPPVDQNALRAARIRPPRYATPDPVSLTTRPAPASETSQPPSGATATPIGSFSPDAITSTCPLRIDTTRPVPSSAAATVPSAAIATP